MARIILVTGGSRSGKSTHAQRLAEAIEGRRAFVATCPMVDDEMADRIRRHRDARQGAAWDTIEEQIDIAGALTRSPEYDAYLVDCLTLWVNNLMYEAEQSGMEITEDVVAGRASALLDACRLLAGTIIFVTNEVGWGIIPDNPASRRYRDLVGRCNQVIADGADTVTLVACGLPMNLKGGV